MWFIINLSNQEQVGQETVLILATANARPSEKDVGRSLSDVSVVADDICQGSTGKSNYQDFLSTHSTSISLVPRYQIGQLFLVERPSLVLMGKEKPVSVHQGFKLERLCQDNT